MRGGLCFTVHGVWSEVGDDAVDAGDNITNGFELLTFVECFDIKFLFRNLQP